MFRDFTGTISMTYDFHKIQNHLISAKFKSWKSTIFSPEGKRTFLRW